MTEMVDRDDADELAAAAAYAEAREISRRSPLAEDTTAEQEEDDES